jgi:hypothetical protein
MGPTVIFDKSTLESLNPDEAVWLDQFFTTNITPLLFIETLADLEKAVREGRSPESMVGSLAYKTPDMSSRPNVHHATLLQAELLAGQVVDIQDGRPLISGGRTTELGGKMGIVFQPSPEEEALGRWQRKEFLDLERQIARAWRTALSNIDMEQRYKAFQAFFPLGKPQSFADVKTFVDFYLDGPDQGRLLRFGLSLIGVTPEVQRNVLQRWSAAGKLGIRTFAPYFTHVLSVDLFFYFALAADLIGRYRPSNKIDVAYLCYLPFCMLFTSNDKLHANIVPHFLRADQSFIPGTELKADLAALDAYYDALPVDTKARGVISFAARPPMDDSFLVTRLWDKHMSPRWREDEVGPPDPEGELEKKIAEEIRRFREESVPVPDDRSVSSDEAHHLIIERKVHGRKGKWTRFPPEAMERAGEYKA